MSRPTARNRKTKAHVPLLALALAALLLTGCGYTTQELYPTRYTTVAIPNFDNRSGERGVEFELREALIKEVEHRTPYKAVSAAGNADTVLEGTVTNVDSTLVSRDSSAGVTQEVEYTVTVDFTWRDMRTGQTLRGYRGFTAVSQFVPVRVIGEYRDDARHRAVQRLAEDIVSSMREDGW